jgi:hypothetical protein
MKLKPYLCFAALLSLAPIVHAADAAGPLLGDAVRNADGSIRYMNQEEGIAYCASIGQHLPTVREYTQWATAQGAKGILETQFKGIAYTDPAVLKERDQNGKNGFFVIYRQNPDGKMVVDHYFNRTGYRKPDGELGMFWYWTASQFPVNSGLVFVFDAPAGVVHYGFYHAKRYPVRCSAGPVK